MNIRPVVAELLHSGGQKDRHDKANSHYSQFYERAYTDTSRKSIQISGITKPAINLERCITVLQSNTAVSVLRFQSLNIEILISLQILRTD
jgi:hypothetical protein